MNAYALSVMGTVLLSSILTMLIPEGKCSGLIKGVAKLACIVVLIAPVPQFLKNDNFFDVIRGEGLKNTDVFFDKNGISADESFIRYYCELRVACAQTNLEKELYEKYGVNTNVSLSWKFKDGTDADGVEILKITVKTNGDIEGGIKEEMTTYLMKTYCSEVKIE